MKAKFLMLVCFIPSSLLSANPYQYDYVYYHPSLSSNSAPFSFYQKRRVREIRRAPQNMGVPRLHRKVVYTPATYTVHEKQVRYAPKNKCRTHNNIVKEINGGSPRHVVNGTFEVCGTQSSNREMLSNFDWSWQSVSPYYRKAPIYLEKKPELHRYIYWEDEYHRAAQRAQRTYYYR